jgi:cytochrome c-type biogenesis protein CcmH/NrfG
MSRPRAADDSAVIRARLEELRRERGQVSVEPAVRPTDPRPYSPARGETKQNAHPQIIRAWLILTIVNLVVILLLAVLAAVVYYRILDRAVLFFAQLLHGLASP